MKPLEQKAREYTKSQCGYNVNCNPNESCIGCQWFDNHITQAQMKHSQHGYIAGYTEALRWRDVNAELPEVGIDVFVKDEYNGNLGKPVYWVSWINKRGYFTMLQTFGNDYTNKPTHWRPIETI